MNSAALHELGFAPRLINHLLNYDDSSLLGFRCQPPQKCQSSPIHTRPIIPLWECGTTLIYFHNESRFYEKCSLEDIDDVWSRYNSVQAVLAGLLIDLYEDELSDEELRSVAAVLGFEHVERLLTEVGATSLEFYGQWATTFPSTCNG